MHRARIAGSGAAIARRRATRGTPPSAIYCSVRGPRSSASIRPRPRPRLIVCAHLRAEEVRAVRSSGSRRCPASRRDGSPTAPPAACARSWLRGPNSRFATAVPEVITTRYRQPARRSINRWRGSRPSARRSACATAPYCPRSACCSAKASGALREPGHILTSRTPPRISSSTTTRACAVDGFTTTAYACGEEFQGRRVHDLRFLDEAEMAGVGNLQVAAAGTVRRPHRPGAAAARRRRRTRSPAPAR